MHEYTVAPGIEVWHSTGRSGRQRILPDGCLDLLFAGDRLLVAGPDSTVLAYTDDAAADDGRALARRRGPCLLGVPADVLHDRQWPVEGVWGDGRARA